MNINKKCKFTDKCKKFKTLGCTESCVRYVKLNYLFINSLLPEEHFKNKVLTILENDKDIQSFDTLAAFEKNIINHVKKGQNLYIYSPIPGNGKTTWAVKLMRSYLNKIWATCELTPKALFINIPRYLLALKSSISENNEYVNHIKEWVMQVDIVVWDDVATKVATEFEHENLLSMIDYRLFNNKANIFTSNILPENLVKLLGSRLSSRIGNEALQVKFLGADKRGSCKGKPND